MYFSTTTVSAILSLSALAAQVTAQEETNERINYSGELSSLDAGLGGIVTVTSPTTLVISEYTLEEASAPALYWWGSATEELRDGFRISNEQVTEEAQSSTLEIQLDADMTSADFMTVGLWCERFAVNFGQAVLAKGDGSTTAPIATPSGEAEKPMETNSGAKSVNRGVKNGFMLGVAAVAGVAAFVV